MRKGGYTAEQQKLSRAMRDWDLMHEEGTTLSNTHYTHYTVPLTGLGTRPLLFLLTGTQGHRPLTIRCSTDRGSHVKWLD